MALDYNGAPERNFRRRLEESLDDAVLSEDFSVEETPDTESLELFNNIAKTLIKGNKLKEALANLNPLSFIPVNNGDSVQASLARLGESQTEITYGLFKKAVDFLEGRDGAIDETFLVSMADRSPQDAGIQASSRHKGLNPSDKDLLSQFMALGAPLAGVIITGLLVDLAAFFWKKTATPDGANSGTQSFLYAAQGIGPAIAILLETGFTLAGMAILANEDIFGPEVAQQYEELSQNPEKRKKVLEDAGYDYDSFVSNKKFDDYLAIKNYCIEYISKQGLDIQYDHWIGYLNVSSNQSMLNGAIAMAPMYSRNWYIYKRTEDPAALSSQYEIEEDGLLEEMEEAVFNGLNFGARSYFSQLLTASESHYNQSMQVYSMLIDQRLLCCLLWFIGPMDTTLIKKIAQILRIVAHGSWPDIVGLLKSMVQAIARELLNIILTKVTELIDKVFGQMMKLLTAIPGTDLEVAIIKCLGLDILFRIIEQAFLEIFQFLLKIVKSLKDIIAKMAIGSDEILSVTAERRMIAELAGFLQLIAEKIDQAIDSCEFDSDLSEDELNDIAAEAAVQFVSNEQYKVSYPVLQVSDDIVKKYFNNTESFTTKRFKIVVPSLQETSEAQGFTVQDAVYECGEGGRAREGLVIGKKIANIINNSNGII